ncbi:hypothetical protein ACJIZ3_006045 [Penstemon smallii]|uniref:Uncharacterized protein n=1 Tax=Penstemon smallii TaxID=265156 RepID=A0ABD3S6K5_9LAMI
MASLFSSTAALPIFSLILLAFTSMASQADARAFFVFGDSLVDNGNNNYLITSARADSPPYGIDYPSHRPTGRFSNGLNIPDIISEQMGMEPTLPYLSPLLRGESLLVGANFASAGVGILNDTGLQFLNIIRMGLQLEYFEQYQTRVGGLIGSDQTQALVNQALVLITLGGNDFVNNYYLVPFSARSRQFSLPDYVQYLVSEYRKILRRLYDLGARRVLVTGTGPMGCVPAELAQRSRNGECAEELMRAAGLFNPQLTEMLSNLNSEIGTDRILSHIIVLFCGRIKRVFFDLSFCATMKMAYLVNNSSFCVVFLLILALENLGTRAETKAFFVFGDSLVDNGNNNFLATLARADAPPYGIDYPTHQPTGRFSNGRNIPDIIKLKDKKLLVGANFASAGVGVLNDTGIQFVDIIRIHQQFDYFVEYQKKVIAIIGEEETKKLVNESLVLITIGGNDFVNNYYLIPFSARSQQYGLQDYVPFLVSEYKKVLQRLHQLGVGRVLVTGTGPLGCVPAELALHSRDGECAEELQQAASLYNPQLVQMLDALNKDIGHDVFIAANTNQMHMDFITNPEQHGFKVSKVACCGQGPYNGLGLCTPLSNLCENRDEYVFWDAFHPSERANRMIVDQLFNGSDTYMYPMNLNTIMA